MNARLRVTVGWAAALAALIFVGLLAAGGSTVHAAGKEIAVKPSTITNVSCEPGAPPEWHFVINQIDKAANAPASITVTWDNGATEVVPLEKFTGGVAHYTTTSNLAANVTNATATIYDRWRGQFNLSHGPCAKPLAVSKTAVTSYTRTYDWTIAKSVDDGSLTIPVGGSATANYTVTVTADAGTDSDFAVTGTITIVNPNSWIDATITSVADVVSTDIAATVDCDVAFPYVLAASGTLTCTYAADLPDASARTNKATVTTSGKVAGGNGTAAVTFGDPSSTVDECVAVTDSYAGDLGSACVDESPKSFTYSRTFTIDDLDGVCGEEVTFPNTATSTTNDSATEDTADESVSVEATCAPLQVSKTAAPSYTRTFTWDIAKIVDNSSLQLPLNQTSVTANYTVTVTASGPVDSGFAVSGTITITNPNLVTSATIESVADVVSPDVAATVDCDVTFPYDLAAEDSLECSYSGGLPNADDRLNTATVTTSGDVPGGSGTANVDFGDPTNVVDDCVVVTDSNFADPLGGACAGDSPKVFSYSRTFTHASLNGVCGTPVVFDNTATSTTNTTGTTDTAGASVSVTGECTPLQVSKTANTSFSRSFTWTIVKDVDNSSLFLPLGQTSVSANYTVTVTASAPIDSNFAVSGVITVTNPNSGTAATIQSVADVVSPDIGAAVDCGVAFPYSLAGGQTLNCAYSGTLPDATGRTNSATVATSGPVAGGSGTASVVFGSPAVVTDECVTVTDTFAGNLGTACAAESPKAFTYSRTFDRTMLNGVCGEDVLFDNTATYTAPSGATGSDDATVAVNAECQTLIFGCSPGYYKNHTTAVSGLTLAGVGFNVPAEYAALTLQQAADLNGGGLNGLLRQASAAYQNAALGLEGFPYSTGDVVALTNQAIADSNFGFEATFESYNHGALATGGCPLN